MVRRAAAWMSPSAAGREVSAPSDIPALLFLALVWIALSVLSLPLGDFPINDDWVHGLAVKALLATGRFSLPSVTAANLLVQVYWGALFCLPFGFSFTALRLSTLALGLVGVLSLFALLREARASRRLALFGALSVAVNPLYFGLAHSFMSDVPFLALVLVATWLFVRGITRDGAGWMIAGFALAMLDILLRQFALAAVVGFGIAYVFRRGITWKTLAVAILPVTAGLALHLSYARWLIATGRMPFSNRDPLSDLIPASAASFLHRSGENVMAALPGIGLLALPFLLASLAPVWRGLSPRRRWAAGGSLAGFAVLLLAANHLLHTDLPQRGNVLYPPGLGPLMLRDTLLLNLNLPASPIWMEAFWALALGLGALAGVAAAAVVCWQARVVIAALWHPENRRRVWLSALIIALAGAYGLALLLVGLRNVLLDRYFLPFGPLVCLLVVAAVDNPRASAAGDRAALAVLVVLGLFSVGATHDYLAWNRARWTATAALTAAGIDAKRIDGGYEFNGWFTYDPAYVFTEAKSWWWVVDDEYVIASGPVPGYRVEQEYAFSRWLLADRGRVMTLHRLPAPQSP